MRSHLVLVHLAEDGGLVVDSLGFPAEQAGRQAGNLIGKGQFGAGQNTDCQSWIVRGGKPASSRPEVTCYELIADLRRPRTHALKAKVTHWRLLSSRSLRQSAPQPLYNDLKQEQCRAFMLGGHFGT